MKFAVNGIFSHSAKRPLLFAALLSIALVTYVGSVQAGGLYLQEFATPSMGVASAGAEAVCMDASTAWHNPAGMTRLEGNQFMLASGIAKTNVEFDVDTTTISGGDGGNAGGYSPLGAAFYTRSLSDDWKLGVSLGAMSSALLDYDDDWVGRYECQETSIMTVALIPSIAYRINDQWSIGGGINLLYGKLELDAAVPRGILPDGQASLDGDDVEVGFSLSAFFEPSKRTRVGVVYFSKVETSFEGDLTFKPSGISIGTDLELTFPQFIRVGIYHELNEKWALLGTVAWEEWSDLDNLLLSTTAGAADIPRNWDDTWHFAAGVRYRIDEQWLVEGGISHDTSPVDSVDRTADMPVDKQLRLSLGVEQKRSDTVTWGLVFEYGDFGDAKIRSSSAAGDFVGKFDKNNFFSLAFNVNWK